MKTTGNMFKSKAKSILKNTPQSIKELLEDNLEKSDVQMHNGPNGDMHNQSMKDGQSAEFVRFHVHIRQDLADKVFEAVFQRKKNKGKIKKEASQRAIIEEALEKYFKRIIK
jgi:hypothetical protein